jgi:exopolyphosphatase/guanosine-5'-triphosphate,3'-diphosphate pyrophosphatase
VRSRAGIEVEVLSGIEEARLIGLAAWQGCGQAADALVNIDIGGGSTEITLVKQSEPAQLFSVKVGAVRLTESHIADDPPRETELQNLRDEVTAAFENPAREMRASSWNIATGTSGTILAIGEALRNPKARVTNKDAADPLNVKFDSASIKIGELESFNARTARLPLAERRNLTGISAQRAEIIIAGGAILEGVMHALGIVELRSCDWALREGVVVDHLREIAAERLPPVPDIEDPRLHGVRVIGERFRYEESHARHVAYLAERIFDQLTSLHSLTRHQRTMLAAAALLHDVGYAVAHEAHHKHSQYIIRHSELTGFSEAERVIISLIARYHRRATPKEKHLEFLALKPAQRDVVWRLGGILRLAEALDRKHDGSVRDIRCRIEARTPRVIHFYLDGENNFERELRALEAYGAMFSQAFECRIAYHHAPPNVSSAGDLTGGLQ